MTQLYNITYHPIFVLFHENIYKILLGMATFFFNLLQLKCVISGDILMNLGNVWCYLFYYFILFIYLLSIVSNVLILYDQF